MLSKEESTGTLGAVPERAPVPLQGIKVLDLSRVLAGPFCTQVLADLGATVWKVEPPWGDETRGWGPPFVGGESAYFLSANRGKKSLAVDLKHEEGRQVVRALAGRADVLVENFKTGDLARYGLDYEHLAGANPRLVYVSITGFGHDGPRAMEPGYDIALQGMTGIMSVTGCPDGPPTKVGVAWIDVMTGLTAAVGVLAALRERDRSGLGQHLDLSLFDVGVMAMANLAQSYLVTGRVPRRLGNAHAQLVPYQAFEAADGWLIVAVGNDDQFRRFADTAGLAGLARDPRFATNAARVEHREELVAILAEAIRARPRGEWIRRLQAARVPVSPVYDLGEVFADPQAQARRLVWQAAHPAAGVLPMVASPFQHFSRTPAGRGAPPPLLGEHTAEVLRDVLGMEEQRIEAMEAAGIVRTALRGKGRTEPWPYARF
ncbi:CaiB/BaiF CoA-transferase family protein [Carboxydochorda subterranea]|uniref:CaiB/BaiF CoA-transferase family protein n=1 Tax=Carboxydichorda subterranea TaxID=3109565 RepID=A0ABZ1BXN7_9FIRM|nr:CaiB/BaiF CoA-transferase family protein [Limnochorda sp. L945t]WRP17575.1 CaiB/BaiF CoA-transferase family protein [Limnochorda sp. L945t]